MLQSFSQQSREAADPFFKLKVIALDDVSGHANVFTVVWGKYSRILDINQLKKKRSV